MARAELPRESFPLGYHLRVRGALTRPIRRADLVDAFAPAPVPRAVDDVLDELEAASPSWQRDIYDSCQPGDLRRAEVVVSLEGPDHIAMLAEQVRLAANPIRDCWARVALKPFFAPQEGEPQTLPSTLLMSLMRSVQGFTEVARDHLNDH
ncbi:hypothetical protein ACFRIC_16785 [Streptomyces sp. NPDC056738]|uniref:hypothetical protein n=1 Tax=Streptomyces sp. NPDC056738 TaxID=3345933 RepID=UPI0036AF761C